MEIFPEKFLFCNKEREKIKGQEQILTNVKTAIFEENIRKYANWKEDNLMLAKISQTDFATKVVQYHKRCGAKYQKDAESIFHNKSRKTLNDASSTHIKINYEWHKEREVHSDVKVHDV